MFKVLLKDLNVENVKSRLLRDVQNVRVFGIAQESAKCLIGQIIRQHVIKKLNK